MKPTVIVLAITCCAGGPALACSPPLELNPLTAAQAREVALDRLNHSVVVVDGTIEWSPRGWRANETGRGRKRLPLSDLYPTVRVARTLKGARQSAYKVRSSGDCGDHVAIELLPAGTPVRLLLRPAGPAGHTAFWSVIDTSFSGSREDERRVDALIDDLLGSTRDPAAASLVNEPPPPPPE